MSPPTFAERFDLGGLAGRVGLKAGGGNIGGGIIEGTNLGDRTGFAEIDIGDRKTRSPHQGVTKIGKPVTVSENVKKYTYLDKATNKKITIFKALILDRPTEIGGKMTAGIEGDYKNALLKDEFHTLEKAQDAVTNYRKKNPKKVIVKDPDAPKKSKDLKKQKIIAAKGAPLWLTGDPKIHKGHATTVANPDITIKPGNIFATPEKINVAMAPKKIKNVKEIKTPYTDLDFKIAELETQAKEIKNSNLPDSEKIPKLNAIDEKLTGYAFDSKGYKTVRLSDGTLFNSGQASTQSYDMADIFPSDWSEAKTKKFVSNYLTEEGKLKSQWHVDKDGFLKNDPSTKLSNIDRANIEKSHIFLENVKNAKANAKKILPKVEKEFKKFGLTLNSDQVNKAKTFLRSTMNKGQNIFRFMPKVTRGGVAVLDYALFHYLFGVAATEAWISASGWLTKNDLLQRQIFATSQLAGVMEEGKNKYTKKKEKEVDRKPLVWKQGILEVADNMARGGLSGVDQYILNRYK